MIQTTIISSGNSDFLQDDLNGLLKKLADMNITVLNIQYNTERDCFGNIQYSALVMYESNYVIDYVPPRDKKIRNPKEKSDKIYHTLDGYFEVAYKIYKKKNIGTMEHIYLIEDNPEYVLIEIIGDSYNNQLEKVKATIKIPKNYPINEEL